MENLSMTRTIVLAKDKYGYAVTFDDGDWLQNDADYAVISEPVTIKFSPLSPAAVLSAQVKVLDKAEEELRNKFALALNDILARKQSLLALDAPTETPPSFDTCLVTD